MIFGIEGNKAYESFENFQFSMPAKNKVFAAEETVKVYDFDSV